MKFFLPLLAIMATLYTAEARYITRLSQKTVVEHRRNMEYHFGHGLVGLIHPVTKEFNHEAVIARRGGRHEWEKMGTLNDYYVPHLLGAIGSLVGNTDEANAQYLMTIGTHTFDRYDTMSLLYGWASSLVEDPTAGENDEAAQITSDCFISLFELLS